MSVCDQCLYDPSTDWECSNCMYNPVLEDNYEPNGGNNE